MGLKLVIERECSRDHQTALRQFLCCEPGGPEWAMLGASSSVPALARMVLLRADYPALPAAAVPAWGLARSRFSSFF